MVLQWMGMNALIIYALAACDLFTAAIQGFVWGSPENNLV
jgi:heparan-alpha-glucosaminide N-acetyltransferase